jgi:hypothetical protein
VSVRLVGDWRRARRTLEGSAQKLRRGMEAAVREQAQRAKREVVQGIRRQAPGGEALDRPSPLTLASRKLEGVRGQKALQETGEHVRAITYVARGLEAFVGIRSSARGSDGRALARVAEVQEEGSGPIVIPMTPAMRRYLGALRSKADAAAPNRAGAGAGVIVVTIPPRPFLRPAFHAAVRGARQRLREHIARRFGLA